MNSAFFNLVDMLLKSFTIIYILQYIMFYE